MLFFMDTYELKIRRTEHLNKLSSQIADTKEQLGFNHEIISIISSSLSDKKKLEEINLKLASRQEELQSRGDLLEHIKKAWE